MTVEAANVPVSGATKELIDLCLAVKEGAEERLPELQSKLQERRQQLTASWEGFGKALEEETEEFVAPRKPLIEAVEAQFLAYSNALDKIDLYLEKKKPERLDEGVQMLLEASPGLFFTQQALEASILTAGPSKYPSVNLFDNLFKALSQGQCPVERWKAACQGHCEFYKGVISEIEASPSANDDGVPERKAAATRILDLLEKFETLTRESPRAEFDALLEGLTQAQLDLESAVRTFNYNAMGKGPTKSTEANQVIYTAQMVRQGKFPPHVLHGQVDQMLDHVRKSMADVQAATRLPAEATLVVEEIPNVLEAMEAMEECLQALRAFEEPSEEIDGVLVQFEEAVDRLTRSNEVLRQHNQTFGKMMCPHCQALNQAGSRTCEKCHGTLPQFSGSEVYGSWASSSFQTMEDGGGATGGARGPVVTRSMEALANACFAFEKGELSQEDLLTVLRTNEENVRRAEARLTALQVPEVPEEATEEERARCDEFLAFAGDTIGLLSQGVSQCMSGLMKLEKYAFEEQPLDMREGLREFFEGCNRLLQIEEVAKSFVAALPPIPEEEGAEAETSAETPPPQQDGTLA